MWHEGGEPCTNPWACGRYHFTTEATATRAAPEPSKGASYDPPPAHYDGGSITPWQVWEAFGLDPWQANVVKYLLRSGKKRGESALSDLSKARNYLGYLIEREEKRGRGGT